jgi:spore coat polysaccharide biosynthesis protein SpsF
MRTVAIVQARMTSSRLPGKVLLPLGSGRVIDSVIDRLRRVRALDAICVAIPQGAAHAPLADHLGARGDVTVTAGDEHDVLDRFRAAAAATAAARILRITADCPLIDPALVEAAIAVHAATNVRYVSTALESGYPLGFDVEIFDRAALDEAAIAADDYEREHVTPFLWRRPERFAAIYLDRRPDRRAWRLTLDTPEDYGVIRAVHARLAPRDPGFGLAEIEALLKAEPGLLAGNAGVPQKPYVGLAH